jgi:hypothetical protein
MSAFDVFWRRRQGLGRRSFDGLRACILMRGGQTGEALTFERDMDDGSAAMNGFLRRESGSYAGDDRNVDGACEASRQDAADNRRGR